MKRSLLFLCTAMIVVGLFGVQAHAIPLRVEFNGLISDEGSFLDPTGYFNQGDLLTGFWEFETTTPDTDPSDSRGSYSQSGLPAFQINIGEYVFESNSIIIQILNDHTLGIGTLDAYDVLALNETTNIANLISLNMQITLRDMLNPLDVFDNDSLPLIAPDPASFDQSNQVQGQITGSFDGQQFFMNLEITSTTIIDQNNPVPEPATMLLFGFGILGLAGVSRKK